MARLPHGVVPDAASLAAAQQALSAATSTVVLGFALAEPVDLHDFDYMFLSLQSDPANLLPTDADMPEKLKALGRAMEDADVAGDDSTIPAAYTYFGQFVDHDITLEVQDFPQPVEGSVTTLLEPTMKPADLSVLRNAMRNFRTGTLDLDNLYGLPASHDTANPHKMAIGHVTELNAAAKPLLRPPGKGDDNDLPREPPSADRAHDRAALIGDPRNDENTIVSQLHLAFLKAHNALVDEGRSRVEAERVLRQHYQHLVVHDFLKRVADPAVVDDIVTNGNRWFNALGEPFFMPLEFAAAAYRFGHSMVRTSYDFNLNFNRSGEPGTFPASLGLLFDFTALSGEFGGSGTDTLPENWIIEWERLTGSGPGVSMARKLDTELSSVGGAALFALQGSDGQVLTPPDAARLSVRNLLRGYRLRMPTGQAVATHLGLPVLSAAELRAAAGPGQEGPLVAGGFDARTPLWYYVLAEAKHHGGERLGPVGSTIVAEVLVGLVRRSADSILAAPGWTPTLPGATPGQFELADLLRFAGVLGARTGSTTYVVKRGDTLTRIAQQQLGDGSRWPEIFLANRATIRNPNLIRVGQVLTLPTGPAQVPQPRIHVVKRGDTLSRIAGKELGQQSRWTKIFEANRSVITNPDVIVPGMVLIIPST